MRMWTKPSQSPSPPTCRPYPRTPNKSPETRKQRGPGGGRQYSFRKKDRFLIYKSSKCTEFSFKKIVIHNKYSTKKFILQY